MMHLDLQVGELDAAVAEAVALGASVAAHQPQENVRALLDPAATPSACVSTRSDGRPARAVGQSSTTLSVISMLPRVALE